jgi:hypothetical protein
MTAIAEFKKQRELDKQEFRHKIVEFEDKVSGLPMSIKGDIPNTITNHFVDGAYVREMFAPKGYCVITKIHKKTHPFFVMSGEVSVMTENGYVRVKAPYWGITKAGTKRICYMHTDSVWITVHATNETDIDKIEDEVIAKSYDDFEKGCREIKGGQV